MENLKNRAVIEYLFKSGLNGEEIYYDMVNVLGDNAPSYTTVKKWVALFKLDRTDINDDPRSGRPKTATTPEMIDCVHDLVMKDRRLTVVDLAEATGISTGSVHEILTIELGMRKLLTRWVPHSLNSDQKRNRMKLSQQHLKRFQRNKTNFMRQLVTMDEVWVYHYDPELRQQTAEWTQPGCSAPKQTKRSKSAKKVLASIFWDAKGILLIDYLQTGKTITGEYYSHLLDQLNTKIKEKRPGSAKKKSFFFKTMHRLTKVFLQWPNLRSYTTNCWSIHHIHQIWPPLIFICSQTSKNPYVVSVFHQMKKLWQP